MDEKSKPITRHYQREYHGSKSLMIWINDRQKPEKVCNTVFLKKTQEHQGVVCPLCGHNQTAFFARHKRVEQLLYHCQDCGLFFVHPHLPYPDSGTPENEAGGESGFWAGPEAHLAYSRWREAENQEIAAKILSGGRISRFLEIGFGEGPLARRLLPVVAEYWGIEPQAAIYEGTVEILGLDRCRVFCLRAEALAESAPFNSLENYFGVIILISVLEHLSQPVQVLQTLYKLLAPGGRLYISTPDSKFFRWLYYLRLISGMETWSYFHISFWDEPILERVFRQVRFILRSKERRWLITPDASEYFHRLTGNKLIKWAMTFLSSARVDRLLHINTLFYVLEKQLTDPGLCRRKR